MTVDELRKYLISWQNWLQGQREASVSRDVLNPFENYLQVLYDWLNPQTSLDWRTYVAFLWWLAESRAKLDCGKAVDIDRQKRAIYVRFVEANRIYQPNADVIKNLYQAYIWAQGQIGSCR
ncbi:hypothetical protein COM11_24010 [Bacillus pseudomycoides]|uniref:hypothetical protein n=1 Tax=Bacillus pseudomycoides TaxID=64104 RepID=UPI000BF5AAF0|nr:hypothetical protein [Bacillus pseudomycoides]PGC24857.1 hypothetical protein COM11_24010 [Bacillus pseudomycoides]